MNEWRSRSTEVKWILLLWSMTLGWFLVERSMGWHGPKIEQHAYYTNIYDILLFAGLGLSIWDKRRKHAQEPFSWRDAFISGIVVTGGLTLLSPLTQYIVHTWISPEFFSNMIDLAVSNGILTAEEASERFNLGTYILQSLGGTAIFGTIASAILALLLKQKA